QHRRYQESARKALTDQEEGHSLNHQQDRAKDHAWNGAEGDEQAEQFPRGLRPVREAAGAALGVVTARVVIASQLTGPIAAIRSSVPSRARGAFSTNSFSKNQVGARLRNPAPQPIVTALRFD
ncbi:MAG TPA: hypothetical protein VNZ53_10835, partial [Steroidobacteraceae bacterium]|nr:hypothetical protein [Steroidobacteraceae bacterium]